MYTHYKQIRATSILLICIEGIFSACHHNEERHLHYWLRPEEREMALNNRTDPSLEIMTLGL